MYRTVPKLAMSSLPVAALSRYALHYGLIGPDPLTHAQASHPTPPLPLHLSLASGSVALPRRRASLVPTRKGDIVEASEDPEEEESKDIPVEPQQPEEATSAGIALPNTVEKDTEKADDDALDQPSSAHRESAILTSEKTGTLASSGAWADPGEPDAPELRGMTAYEGGYEQFQERVGRLAKAHWEKYQTVKEGETIVNFAYAIRMRSELAHYKYYDNRVLTCCTRVGKVLKSVPPP